MAPNDPDDIAKYLDYLVSSLRDDKNDLKATSEEHRKTLAVNNERAQKIVDAFNRGDISNKELTKRLIELVKETRNLTLEIQNTEKSNQIDRALRNRLIQVFEEVGRIDKKMFEKLATVFSNVESFSIFKTIKDSQSGNDSNPIFKNVIGNKKLEDISDDINKKLDLKIDSFQSKLFSFFEDKTKETDKKRKRMIDDLIEGLASSKFIGGALSDTFKLIGLMGASWLSHFGQLGRILGGALYIAMTAFGPSITKMLVEGLGKLMWSGLKFLSGTIWKAITSQALRQGAGNLIYSMSKNGVSPALQAIAGTGAEKAAGIAKVGGLGLAAGAGFMGAKWAGGEAADSWRQGRKGNAVAMGAGAGLLGAGALAALGAIFVPALAPVVVPLLAIGAAVAGISKLWKEHSETIKKIAKPVGEFIKKALEFFWIMTPIGMLFRGLKTLIDHFGQDTTKVESIGDLSLNKQGAAINVGAMTKMQASKAAEELRSKRSDQFNNVYELLGSKHASLASFQNDWAIRNKAGQATQAILYKGASQNLEQFWDQLVASGMSRERAQLLKYTSGRATKTSGHSKGGWKSHDNLLNLVTDMAEGNQWTDKEWETALRTLQPIAAQQGFEIMYEGYDSRGKRHFSKDFKGGLTNRHFHIQPLAKMETPGAKKNEESYKKQKVEATKHSVEVEKALKEANDSANTVDQYRDKKMNAQERASVVESVMKQQGFKYDNKQNTWVKASTDDINKVAIIPPTGNDDFLSVQQNLSTVVMYGGNQERIS